MPSAWCRVEISHRRRAPSPRRPPSPPSAIPATAFLLLVNQAARGRRVTCGSTVGGPLQRVHRKLARSNAGDWRRKANRPHRADPTTPLPHSSTHEVSEMPALGAKLKKFAFKFYNKIQHLIRWWVPMYGFSYTSVCNAHQALSVAKDRVCHLTDPFFMAARDRGKEPAVRGPPSDRFTSTAVGLLVGILRFWLASSWGGTSLSSRARSRRSGFVLAGGQPAAPNARRRILCGSGGG